MNISAMNVSVATTLAQIIPVLFLTLLFEVRVHHGVKGRSGLGIILGFVGNLGVAATAVILEFSLLNIVQSGGTMSGANFEWIASIALFVIVVVRWVATTTLARIVANNGPTFRVVLANSLKQFDSTFNLKILFLDLLLAPSQVFANVLIAMRDILRSSSLELVMIIISVLKGLGLRRK